MPGLMQQVARISQLFFVHQQLSVFNQNAGKESLIVDAGVLYLNANLRQEICNSPGDFILKFVCD
jgi:hypothetical protein